MNGKSGKEIRLAVLLLAAFLAAGGIFLACSRPVELLSEVTVDPNPLMVVDSSRVDLFAPGQYEVYYIANDVSGNVAVASAAVTVLEKKECFPRDTGTASTGTSLCTPRRPKDDGHIIKETPLPGPADGWVCWHGGKTGI